jgi:hypothetical protein
MALTLAARVPSPADCINRLLALHQGIGFWCAIGFCTLNNVFSPKKVARLMRAFCL